MKTIYNLPGVFSLLFLCSGCCEIFDTCEVPGLIIKDEPHYTYLWLTTSQDAYVDSRMPEFNGGGAFSLDVNHGLPNGERRSYFQFFIPQLPAGTEVLEAFINVYEDSQQVPGSDGIKIAEATSQWNASTITWENEPTPPGSGHLAGFSIGRYINRNMWRTTKNIKEKAQKIIDNPASHYGFILSNESQYNFTRGFTSMNSLFGRTATDFGHCPRLLLKVKSDQPLNRENIGTQVYGPNEFLKLYGPGKQFLVYKISTGKEWPSEWEVPTQ